MSRRPLQLGRRLKDARLLAFPDLSVEKVAEEFRHWQEKRGFDGTTMSTLYRWERGEPIGVVARNTATSLCDFYINAYINSKSKRERKPDWMTREGLIPDLRRAK